MLCVSTLQVTLIQRQRTCNWSSPGLCQQTDLALLCCAINHHSMGTSAALDVQGFALSMYTNTTAFGKRYSSGFSSRVALSQVHVVVRIT